MSRYNYKSCGDFGVLFSWFNPQPRRLDSEHEPVMALVRRAGGEGRSFMIALSAAYLYADSESGQPTPYLLQRAFTVASVLGLHPDRSTIRRICDAIVDNLPELIRMPPWEAYKRSMDVGSDAAPEGSAKLTIDGQSHELELRH